jgi:Flp pilus assembly pilin Flp
VANQAQTTRSESGQGLVEYALIIAIVALGAILALGFLSGRINDLFSKAGSSVDSVNVAAGGEGGPPGGGVPAPGTVSINPSTEQQLNVNFTSTPSGWTNTPTSYTFQWQRTNEIVGCSGAFSNVGAAQVDMTSPFQGSLSISTGSDNNRCYRVVVSAANGSGTSATNATSATVLVSQNISSVTASHSPTTPQVDGVQLTATADTGNDLATTFTFQWRRNTVSEATNNCNNLVALLIGASDWGSLVTVNDPLGALTKTNTTTTEVVASQDYCYWVNVQADNIASSVQSGTSFFSGPVFVEG